MLELKHDNRYCLSITENIVERIYSRSLLRVTLYNFLSIAVNQSFAQAMNIY